MRLQLFGSLGLHSWPFRCLPARHRPCRSLLPSLPAASHVLAGMGRAHMRCIAGHGTVFSHCTGDTSVLPLCRQQNAMANVRRLATKAVHSGERHGRPKIHDTCTTPVRAAGSACWFQHSQ